MGEAQRDRAIALLTASCIVMLLAVVAVGGFVGYRAMHDSAPVESHDVRAYGDRTPVSPEVAEENRLMKQAHEDWIAKEERKRLGYEADNVVRGASD